MITAITITVVLCLTILAFVIKEGMLYAVNIATWIYAGFLLYNQTWPTGNTFFAYGAILICVLVAIIMLVKTLNFYLYSRRVKPLTGEEEQSNYRRQIYNITHRNKKEDFWR